MQKAGGKRKGVPPPHVLGLEEKRVRVGRSGDFDSADHVATTRAVPWLPIHSEQRFDETAVITNAEVMTRTYSRAASAPPQLFEQTLREEENSTSREYRTSFDTRTDVGAVDGTPQAQAKGKVVQRPTRDLDWPTPTKEVRIKQEDDFVQQQGPFPASLMAEGLARERAQVLAKRINRLIERRKDHLAKAEGLRKRIRQSKLSYADLMRKRNRLEDSLADLKVKLDSDEHLLEEEASSADKIPAEIEQASAELAALISR